MIFCYFWSLTQIVLSQGFDDIPKKIPEPGAKKLHILIIQLYMHLLWFDDQQMFSLSVLQLIHIS